MNFNPLFFDKIFAGDTDVKWSSLKNISSQPYLFSDIIKICEEGIDPDNSISKGTFIEDLPVFLQLSDLLNTIAEEYRIEIDFEENGSNAVPNKDSDDNEKITLLEMNEEKVGEIFLPPNSYNVLIEKLIDLYHYQKQGNPKLTNSAELPVNMISESISVEKGITVILSSNDDKILLKFTSPDFIKSNKESADNTKLYTDKGYFRINESEEFTPLNTSSNHHLNKVTDNSTVKVEIFQVTKENETIKNINVDSVNIESKNKIQNIINTPSEQIGLSQKQGINNLEIKPDNNFAFNNDEVNIEKNVVTKLFSTAADELRNLKSTSNYSADVTSKIINNEEKNAIYNVKSDIVKEKIEFPNNEIKEEQISQENKTQNTLEELKVVDYKNHNSSYASKTINFSIKNDNTDNTINKNSLSNSGTPEIQDVVKTSYSDKINPDDRNYFSDDTKTVKNDTAKSYNEISKILNDKGKEIISEPYKPITKNFVNSSKNTIQEISKSDYVNEPNQVKNNTVAKVVKEIIENLANINDTFNENNKNIQPLKENEGIKKIIDNAFVKSKDEIKIETLDSSKKYDAVYKQSEITNTDLGKEDFHHQKNSGSGSKKELIDSNSEVKRPDFLEEVIKTTETKDYAKHNITDTQLVNEVKYNSVNAIKNNVNASMRDLHNTVKSIKTTEIISEITKHFQNADVKSIVFQLSPENLGKIKLMIDYAADKISANIEVENEQIKQFIQSNIEQLKNNLQNSGILVSNLNVNLGNNEQRFIRNAQMKKKGYQNSNTVRIEKQNTENSKKMMGYNTYEFLA